MRFQISLVQERANGGGGNGQNNVSLDDFIRQFFGRPVCHRSAGDSQATEMIWVSSSALNLPREPLRGTSLNSLTMAARNARGPSENFDSDKVEKCVCPSSPPHAHLMSFKPDLAGNDFVASTLKCKQHDGSTLPQMRRFDARPTYSHENFPLSFRYSHFGCLPWHGAIPPNKCSRERQSWQTGGGLHQSPSIVEG